jgi:hypothetical protein
MPDGIDEIFTIRLLAHLVNAEMRSSFVGHHISATFELRAGVAALRDRADRRHLHRQVDGLGPRRVRAIRQRRALGSHTCRHEAALALGRWVFLAPIGYLNAPRATGKSLIHDSARAPLVRRAFEEYATGRSTKEALLKRARGWGLTNRRGKW